MEGGVYKDVRTTECGRSWGCLKERSLNFFDLTCPHGKRICGRQNRGKTFMILQVVSLVTNRSCLLTNQILGHRSCTLILNSYLKVKPLMRGGTTSAFHDAVVVETRQLGKMGCGPK